VYAAGGAERARDAPNLIREILSCETSISREELVQLGYARFDEAAVEHLFGVVAGLNSSVLGEPEIVAQVRAAVALARTERTLGPLLEGLFKHAVAAGRRVRADTAIARGAVSISAVAVDLAERLLDDLSACRALVIGAGTVARAVAQRLAAGGIGQLVVANRSLAAAQRLARETDGQAARLDDICRELERADLAVCATGAATYVVSRRTLADAVRARASRLVVLDLAVPRDVEPAPRELPGLILHDIDEIQRIAVSNLDNRRRELPAAWSIVRAEVRRFASRRAELEFEPVLTDLRRRAEEIRLSELERALAHSPTIDATQRELLDTVTRSVIKKLLHEPTTRIRQASPTAAARAQLEALCDLFGLPSPHDRDRRSAPRCLRVVA
jgi:glutamyl-tRNA reductase